MNQRKQAGAVTEELTDARVCAIRAGGYDGATVATALERLAAALGWAAPGRGAFGGVIREGDRVVVKPNWVMHENGGPGGMEPLLTHSALIRAAVEAALAAGASQVVLGDAPLQRCDFDALIANTGLGDWATSLTARDARFVGLRDFRRTRSWIVDGIRRAEEERVGLEDFVLFDLGRDSLLEPITTQRSGFRVTQYDPRLMERTHAPGRHQYLVSRHIVDADVVINLPKLKTHRKAGVTCALKNLIGINGNKEFLPHHRLGGSAFGGDCYPGFSPTKRALEWVLDRQNRLGDVPAARVYHNLARVLSFVLRLGADDVGVDGAWWGNDTIWRTCLDLNRILLYGGTDGTLMRTPQRRVLHVVDAVVAGHGDGPLNPEPLPLGLLLGGRNAAAVDAVGTRLLGYQLERIPIAREAFGRFDRPIAQFAADDVTIIGDLAASQLATHAHRAIATAIAYPPGWTEAAEPTERRASAA